MILTDWWATTVDALENLWVGFIDFIPNLIGALIIFIIGWIIAAAIGKLVAEILKRIKFDRIFEKSGWKNALEKAEIKTSVSSFIGAIFKWVLLIAFLIAAVQILGLGQLRDFFVDVLNYLPNVIVAAFIFVVAVIIADILEKIVRASVEGARMGSGQVVGTIVKWSIWVFAILTILYQLGIGKVFMADLFRGIVAMIVIAVGLSFGLGGKDAAAEILQDLRNRLRG